MNAVLSQFNWFRTASGVGVLLIVVIYALAGFTGIEPGEVGVLVKNIGANRGMQKEVLSTGLHWVEPFVYDVAVYDTRQHQTEELKELPAASADGQPVMVDLSVQMGLDPAAVPDLHQKIGHEYYERVVYPALRAAIRNKVAIKSSADIYTANGRSAIQDAINEELEKRVQQYGIVTQVNLREVQFVNQDFIKTLEQKAQAEQNVEIERRKAEASVQRSISVANTAEGEKQKRIKAAEANREEQRLAGEGSRLNNEETAKGNLAIALAEAQGTAAKRNALEGSGGERLVQLEWARQLGPNVKVYAVPTGAPGSVNFLDLNGLLKGALKEKD